MNVEHEAARAFYEIEAERSVWPVEHLERQIHTQLFARLLKSRDRDGVMDLARCGQTIERPIIKVGRLVRYRAATSTRGYANTIGALAS